MQGKHILKSIKKFTFQHSAMFVCKKKPGSQYLMINKTTENLNVNNNNKGSCTHFLL